MIRLTQTVQKGGCAAKVAAADLRKILNQVNFPPADPNLLVDGGLFDDAAIFKVTPELALVQTLDFFTPIVDTPFLFGRIAATNALSDVYAMGGEPKTAMAILAFPLATLETSVAVEVLQGACEAMREAQVSFVGGHSIDDDTLKFGLSVTGYVHPNQVWSNAKAQPQDRLILTKPLGTGALTAGLKRGAFSEDEIRDAMDSMSTLNRVRDLLSEENLSAINSATDITGFGFAGHAMQMARASKVSFKINFAKLPRFEKTEMALREGFLTKAHRTNNEYVAATTDFTKINPELAPLIFDPQTSGGLLLSVRADQAEDILMRLAKRFPKAAEVGAVSAAGTHEVTFL